MKGRGLLLVLLAFPVCSALIIVIALRAVDMAATGEPMSAADIAGGIVFGGGSLLVLGISLAAVWRARQHPAWRVYLALLMVGLIVGLSAGMMFGLQIAAQQNEHMMARVDALCARFEVRPENCADRARACIYEVRAAPPAIERGMGAGVEVDPRAPSDPRGAAEWACLVAPE